MWAHPEWINKDQSLQINNLIKIKLAAWAISLCKVVSMIRWLYLHRIKSEEDKAKLHQINWMLLNMIEYHREEVVQEQRILLISMHIKTIWISNNQILSFKIWIKIANSL